MVTQTPHGHFIQRVHERIGPHVDPHAVWVSIIAGIECRSDDVQFVGRLGRCGRRLWRFTVDGEPFFVVFDHEKNIPITVLPPHGEVKRHPKMRGGTINLWRHA